MHEGEAVYMLRLGKWGRALRVSRVGSDAMPIWEVKLGDGRIIELSEDELESTEEVEEE